MSHRRRLVPIWQCPVVKRVSVGGHYRRGYHGSRLFTRWTMSVASVNTAVENLPSSAEGFTGYLQTDGYAGYSRAVDSNGITALGCWAHVRRKFDEALKTQVNLTPEKKKRSLAAAALVQIQALYRIEQESSLLSVDERHRIRQIRSVKRLDAFRRWLDQQLPTVPARSALGKALRYADRQWCGLTTYTADGRLRMDNNLVEKHLYLDRDGEGQRY